MAIFNSYVKLPEGTPLLKNQGFMNPGLTLFILLAASPGGTNEPSLQSWISKTICIRLLRILYSTYEQYIVTQCHTDTHTYICIYIYVYIYVYIYNIELNTSHCTMLRQSICSHGHWSLWNHGKIHGGPAMAPILWGVVWAAHSASGFGKEVCTSSGQGIAGAIPSGNLLHSYWKWPLIVDFPIKNGDFQ